MKMFALAVFCVTISTCFGDTGGLLCKEGKEELDGITVVKSKASTSHCRPGKYFCAAASCIYLDSGLKATQNVTVWGCVERNEPACGLKNDWPTKMLCDPCFVGEKDIDMANGDYTGVFPTAAEYKLTGRKPPPPTPPTPPTTTEKEPLPPATTKATGKGSTKK
uniref:Secreted protein n=1 Tax=Globodera rostochiensis TaxID=31243 RepID=A0A914IBW6_GLORO